MNKRKNAKKRRLPQNPYIAYIIMTAAVLLAVLILLLIKAAKVAPVLELEVTGLDANTPADAQAICRADYKKFVKASRGYDDCLWVWCEGSMVYLANADDLEVCAGGAAGFTRVKFLDDDGTWLKGYIIDPEAAPNELGRISLGESESYNYEDVGMSIREALREGSIDYEGAVYLWKIGTNTVFAVKPDSYTVIDGMNVSFTDDGGQNCFCRILDTDISE